MRLFTLNEYSKDEGKLTIRKTVSGINDFFKKYCKDQKLPFETKTLVLDIL